MEENVVTANGFRLIDSKGRTRAYLACADSDDTPVFSLLNSEGETSVILSASDDGSVGFTMKDRLGERRLFFAVDTKGNPQINLHDSKGQVRVQVSIYKDKVPILVLYDQEGSQGNVLLALDPNGEPKIIGSNAVGVKQFDAG